MITLQCHSCQQQFQIPAEGDYSCPHCGSANRYSQSGRGDPAWVRDFRARPFSAYIETQRVLLFSPNVFFGKLGLSPRYGLVIFFAVVSQFAGYMATFGYQAFFSMMSPALMGALSQKINLEDLIGGMFTPVFIGIMIVLLPIFSVVGVIFSTALNHFFLWLFKGSNNGINATFHAVCYSQGAQVAMIIPLFGGVIAAIWKIVLLIIGLKELQGISVGKSIAVVLLPMCICCTAIVGLILLAAAILVPLIMKEFAAMF